MIAKITNLARASASLRRDAALLLVTEFSQPNGWPTLRAANAEVRHILDEGFARAAFDAQGALLGWVGGLPEYNGNVWELHPLVVRREFRRQGIGRRLVEAFEAEAARRGALTFTLGTDDDSGMTSLSQCADLFADIPGQIAALRDLGRRHPFLFYQRLGYRVTGVLPDANGVGKPDIYMSKSSRPVRLEAEHGHGIDLRGAARRQVGGGKGDQGQQRDRGNQRNRVAGR